MRSISLLFFLVVVFFSCTPPTQQYAPRERISLNTDWRFMKYDSLPDHLIYDVRPEVETHDDNKDADTEPTDAVAVEADREVLKAWILPTGNAFIKYPSKHHRRPAGNPGIDFPFVQADFVDSAWQSVDLPHDWGIAGPFLKGWEAEVGGGMGRLPSHGVAWYRKQLAIPASDSGKSIFLDVDGAMSYAMVWCNGQLVGGWPYGYNSWRLNLTPYLEFGVVNQLAIRIDNPPHSARWYPGGGIYRNVWLTKTAAVHVAHWGTYIRTPEVTEDSAKLALVITLDNDSEMPQMASVKTFVYGLDEQGQRQSDILAEFRPQTVAVPAGAQSVVSTITKLAKPRLWGPPPTQYPHRYLALTKVYIDEELVDEYETPFGIRTLAFDPAQGVIVNGEHIEIRGVNQHHDLGALGAAFNVRAAERQLDILRDLGCNAIRMAHNPPAPELLELTDRMGFLVVDEVFDVWERKKTPLDFHLIFPDWYEQDLRAFIRRDRNHPSIIMWSYGNEVGEQYTEQAGADLSAKLRAIAKDEDPTRPTTMSMNYAKPGIPFPEVAELISLNYQGEGIRNAGAYAHLRGTGITTEPLYPTFHDTFPEKVIVSSETAAAVSSRGTYLFPVADWNSAPVEDAAGGDPESQYVSAYELYTAPFGSSADKVFASQDRHPYVAGEFVWSGWDYLGEPTPYYLARSSYFGIIDLAGFPKDRFYLYQSRWRPDFPMVHILPHWNWPARIGQVTPVHVFTSGDEVELFLNGESLGRKRKGEYEYRLRWDELVYTPGILKAVAYKNGAIWAETTVETTGPPAKLVLKTDDKMLKADGQDLSFVSIEVQAENGLRVPTANDRITLELSGPGQVVATDNGDPTDMDAFPSLSRRAFNGLAMAIIKAEKGQAGTLTLKARATGLEGAILKLELEK